MDEERWTSNHTLIGSSSGTSIPGYSTNEFFLQEQSGIAQELADMFSSHCRKKDLPCFVVRKMLKPRVPPSKPIIYDSKRRDMSKHQEAYPEGADLQLNCEVHGGKPRPKLIWYMQSQILNSTYEFRKNYGPNGEDVTINQIILRNLKRNHHQARLSCKASNTPLASPSITTVTIELYMRPLSVEIDEKENYVSANKTYEVSCRSRGSRPPAVLTWWRGSKQLKHATKESQNDGMSTSILKWIPSVEDEGKYLACRAENRHLPEAAIEDKWKLKVYFSPIVTLKMGASLNPQTIKELDDVHFECNVRANPRAYKISWFHEDKVLRQNITAGIIPSDQTLLLQGITRKASGKYTCQATNAEGRTYSNAIYLSVMFAPICKQIKSIGNEIEDNVTPSLFKVPDKFYGTQKHETISLVCEVEANPTEVTFHWTFNNSGDLNDISSTEFTSDRTVSKLNYTPEADKDYGTLGCWAKNDLGYSKQPCLYQITAVDRPFPLQNCSAYNHSRSSIRISCIEGFNGGLPQKFVAVSGSQQWESDNPYWELDLGIHKPATIAIYAVNGKGYSEPVIIDDNSFKGMAKFTGSSTEFSIDISPFLIGLGGTATGLGLIVIGVLMALWRRHATTPSKPKSPKQPAAMMNFVGKSEEDEGNPDLIPTTVITNHLSGQTSLHEISRTNFSEYPCCKGLNSEDFMIAAR
ncbi:nephrin-like [Belonocnema kinseyi]|uniref:nephrin-like n=1 Tax=Belonocnema kinseyi TaxID=2817044 RepID=UPI00143DF2F5|nr:nephrin-like [Belonocnema kinseyi]